MINWKAVTLGLAYFALISSFDGSVYWAVVGQINIVIFMLLLERERS